MKRKVAIFGGGTYFDVACHLSLAARAGGTLARQIAEAVKTSPAWGRDLSVELELTRMAQGGHGGSMVTAADVYHRALEVARDPLTKAVFMTAAVCDFTATLDGADVPGKYGARLDSGKEYTLRLTQARKVLPVFRQMEHAVTGSACRRVRKDIFLVACKSTCGDSLTEMYAKGMKLLKANSCNLVLVNDTATRLNMIVTPEEASYSVTASREEAIRRLVSMAGYRSHLAFTQSTVVEGKPVPWEGELVPPSLRAIVNHAVAANAYKPFMGATVGHFAVKLSDTEFLTSIRKSDFNKLSETGLVYVRTDGPDTVVAYGAKPSVGGQSQRTVFRDHPGFDCIVHFHCPLRPNHPDAIPVISQENVECGSHQCGKNTSDGLAEFHLPSGTIKAVMLDNHGPNIVFNKAIDPSDVVDFIEQNFDLSKKTGGFMLPSA